MRFGLRAQLVTAGSVVLVAVFTITLALLKAAESRLEEQAFDQLRSVRSAKANQIEAEVRQFLANLDALANSRAAAEVLPLAEAFSQLRQPIDRQGLKEYYSDEFARRSNEFTRSDSLTLIPRGAADQAAQTLSIVDNPRAVGGRAR
jgi:cell division septation protein DedD